MNTRCKFHRIDNNKKGKVWFDDVKIVKGNASQTVIVEESNYYPFGLQHKGYNNVVSSNGNSAAQKFGFGGKELNQELGIQWHDFGARNYDASLGRWMNIDPLAEQMRRHSPYNYAFDNPIYFIDPDGMMPFGPGDGILARAVSNPKVQKYASKAVSNAKNILGGSISIKPKLGIGGGLEANIGPVKVKAEFNALAGSAKIKSGSLASNDLKVNLKSTIVGASVEAGYKDATAKISGSLATANLDATVSENGVTVDDASVVGPDVSLTADSSTGSRDIGDLSTDTNISDSVDFTIGAGVKAFKAIKVNASVNLTKLGGAVVNSFKAAGSFFNAVVDETVKDIRNKIDKI